MCIRDRDNGFKDREKAEELVKFLSDPLPAQGVVDSIERKKETKNPPLLYNLCLLYTSFTVYNSFICTFL